MRAQHKIKDRNKSATRLYLILGSLILITVFLIFFVIGDYGLYQIYLLHKQKQEIQNNIKDYAVEQDSLKQETISLETDMKYIEKLARERYRMAKKGEKVFRVIEKKEDQ